MEHRKKTTEYIGLGGVITRRVVFSRTVCENRHGNECGNREGRGETVVKTGRRDNRRERTNGGGPGYSRGSVEGRERGPLYNRRVNDIRRVILSEGRRSVWTPRVLAAQSNECFEIRFN